jgi:hypothetical protein
MPPVHKRLHIHLDTTGRCLALCFSERKREKNERKLAQSPSFHYSVGSLGKGG